MAVRRWLAGALVFLGVGLALNSLLGPLAGDVIVYRYGPSMTNQAVGLDLVALVLATPLALVAAALVARGRPAGLVVALAPATFAAYMAPQYLIGPDYLGLEGNNERFAPLHLGLFVVAVAVIVGAWHGLQLAHPTGLPAGHARRRALVLFAVAAFTGLGRWLPALIDVVVRGRTSESYVDNPTAFWLIALLDLGLVVPAAVTAGVALRSGAAWAHTAAWAVIGWFSLVPASVAAMAVVMQLNDDPTASTANTVTMVTAGVVLTAAAVSLYRPLFSTAGANRRSSTSVPSSSVSHGTVTP